MEYKYLTVCEGSWLLVDRALVMAECPALATCFLLYPLSRDTWSHADTDSSSPAHIVPGMGGGHHTCEDPWQVLWVGNFRGY